MKIRLGPNTVPDNEKLGNREPNLTKKCSVLKPFFLVYRETYRFKNRNVFYFILQRRFCLTFSIFLI